MDTYAGITAGLCWNIAVCFGVPAAGVLLLQWKRKRCIRPFLLGATAFLVSQVLIRIPLLSVVFPGMAWYLDLQINHFYGYWIFLGMSAGLAEETARWVMFRFFLKRNRRPEDAIAFGLGHGGLEAALLTGTSSLYLLAACMRLPPETVAGIYGGLSFGTVFLGGLERFLAILMHMEWSVLALEAAKRAGAGGWKFWAAAVLLHGACDASIGFLQAAGITDYMLEGIFGLQALCMGGAVIWIYRRGRKKEEKEEKEEREEREEMRK